jgi:hypothetical protein
MQRKRKHGMKNNAKERRRRQISGRRNEKGQLNDAGSRIHYQSF